MESDRTIYNDVMEELRFEPSLDESQISVTVKDGIVTLAGQVPSYRDKLTAERTTKRVYGVRGVADELHVAIPTAEQRTDADIAASILDTLRWNSSVPDESISITVDHGWVNLEGAVDWEYQKAAAGNAIRDLTGVRGVVNSIKVTPSVKSAEVREQIHKAFQRNADIDARRIGVDVHDGRLVLHGNVRSWSVREEAQRAAYRIPGVREVENDLTVTP